MHLWLGLSSGLLVCFLGITGCILVFEREINEWIEPLKVSAEQRPFMLPSRLKAEAEKYLDGRQVVSVEYPGKERSAIAYYYNATEYYQVLLNPYSGQVLKVKNMNLDFFRIITLGHYYLWLPPSIGQPIVATATLIFVVMLLTGLVLWWPKNKAARKQRFKIKLDARWRRINYDLHNVLGFYVTWIIIFIAVTGLVMGFQWVANSVYWATSGGQVLPVHADPVSDTAGRQAVPYNAADKIWQHMYNEVPAGAGASIYFAASPTAPIEIFINHRPGTYYKQDAYHFDQYTLQELPATGVFAGKYRDASVANKIARMNYDIHVGAIGGLFTKILAFVASLVTASLPVTGFLVWRGRKKKKKQGNAVNTTSIKKELV